MKLRTKAALLIAFATLGAGSILTGVGVAYGIGALLYAGIAGLFCGGVGVGLGTYKGLMDIKSNQNNGRDMLVEHSFEPFVENTNTKVNTTEQQIYTEPTKTNTKEETINL